MIIVDTEYLIENFKLTYSFITRHAKEMGSWGRPRRFILENVVVYLEILHQPRLNKTKILSRKQLVESVFKETMDKAKGTICRVMH